MTSTPVSRFTAEGPPDFLTVEEAAEVLRIGRTAAYSLTRRYIDTDGADGIPAQKIGRQVRVPRYKLEETLGGPITWPLASATPAPVTQIHPRPTPRRRAKRTTARVAGQTSLPFGA